LDPVITSAGHTYERNALEQHMSKAPPPFNQLGSAAVALALLGDVHLISALIAAPFRLVSLVCLLSRLLLSKDAGHCATIRRHQRVAEAVNKPLGLAVLPCRSACLTLRRERH
jgi:hypothetical protein